ncbi:MAG: amino acid adenylation domain-containing protein [Planctomycetaceae bacterium]
MSDAKKFSQLTPEQRALLERQLLKGRTVKKDAGIPRRDRNIPCPLSFAQQRLWFLDQYESGSSLYNIAAGYIVRGPLNGEAMQKSLDALVERHESLRTVFETIDDSPVQVILKNAKVPFQVIDLTSFPASEREAEAERLSYLGLGTPFDLARDVMIRAQAFKIGADEYLLMFCLHHSAADGWSLEVIIRELDVLYAAFSKGLTPSLPEMPIQYGDFAVWQRQWLGDGVLAKQLEYWKKQLAGAPGVLELPTDRPRPAVETFNGLWEVTHFSKELNARLNDLARAEGSTLFMVLLAAYYTLLSRYTGLEDIVVGSPIAGRSRTEVEGLIGFFVNTVVLRGNLSGDPTFKEFLARVRDTTLDSYSHQDVPFEKLVEELSPNRNLSHSPLYQVLFALQNNRSAAMKMGDLVLENYPITARHSKFNLSLTATEEADGLRIVAEYNTDLFNRDTIQRLIGHYRTLLEAIVASPETKLSALPLLTKEEEQQLLTEWNATENSTLPANALHRLFERQVERSPEKIAVESHGSSLTYAELNRQANQLAHHLRTLGVGPETLVGICVNRSPQMLVGLLGILKSGGAYLPLDPDFPKSRLAFMVEDSKIPVLITESELRDAVGPHNAKTFCLDSDRAVLSNYSTENPEVELTPDNLAYVLYTSGSTGKPKGVQIPHGAVCNFQHSMSHTPGMTADDVLMAVTTLSFDIAGLELFLPLYVGAKIALVSRDVAYDAHRLGDAIRNSGATFMQATPATWRMLLEAGTLPKGLKILCGGEALSRELADELVKFSDSVWNMYGPTETTIWSTLDKVEPGEPIRIGKPIDNTQVYVLDKNRQLVPIGIPGELYIGGDGLARGYLNREELTAEKFVADPFRSAPNARLYRTGDLARWQPNGELECLGRIDHQVKIRGFRIELGEIESVLLAQPGVRQAVVIAREDSPGDKRLAAYVVAEPGAELSLDGLRASLAAQLPEYMVPSAFMILDVLPLTPNGKVDRLALPAPGEGGADMARPYEAPTSPIEEMLCEIWAEVLNVERVGINDNFFQLGGHSLLATRVVSRIRATFDIEIPLRTLFQSPTVSEFSLALLAAFSEAAGDETSDANAEAVADPIHGAG